MDIATIRTRTFRKSELHERARIEVSETSTISPKRIDAQKIFLYSRYAGPLPKTFEVHRDASIATLKDLLRYLKKGEKLPF